MNLKQLIEELRLVCDQDVIIRDEAETTGYTHSANDDDIEHVNPFRGISAMRKSQGIMPKQQFCEMMDKTNAKQREFLFNMIHMLHVSDPETIQVFFTGPAGSGKTFVLKLLMEICNWFSQKHNSMMNLCQGARRRE
jgi:hypothetical protein